MKWKLAEWFSFMIAVIRDYPLIISFFWPHLNSTPSPSSPHNTPAIRMCENKLPSTRLKYFTRYVREQSIQCENAFVRYFEFAVLLFSIHSVWNASWYGGGGHLWNAGMLCGEWMCCLGIWIAGENTYDFIVFVGELIAFSFWWKIVEWFPCECWNKWWETKY